MCKASFLILAYLQVELLSREPVHYIDDINWAKLVESWPLEARGTTITPTNLRKRFKCLILYRIPFQNQLNFNDVIDLLMTHFVKLFRDGKIHPVNGRHQTTGQSSEEDLDQSVDQNENDQVTDLKLEKENMEDDGGSCDDCRTKIKLEQHGPDQREDCVF